MILLPALAFAGIERLLAQLAPDLDAPHRLTRAGMVWGLLVVALSEGLSLGRAITQTNLAAGWGGIALTAWAAAVLLSRREGRPIFPRVRIPASPASRLTLALIVFLLAISGLVAWVAPPQTWDSLNYHMSRVAHWAQDRSVGYFATGIENQNSRPPMAEMAVLHLYVLAQSDHFANFVAWSALLGCAAGAAAIAARLGAKPAGQWLASLCVVTLPMALAQASSTMNDIVVAFWMVCAALELLVLAREGWDWSAVVFLASAAGLAILTKPTALLYLLPFALAAAWVLVRRAGIRWTVLAAGMALLVVGTINAGFLARSIPTYGGPFESGQTAIHLNRVLDPRVVVSNVLRNASLHLGTPNPYVNKAMYLAIDAVHRWIGLDPSDPRTTAHSDFEINAPSTIETRAGNPLHMVLAIVVLGALVLRRRRFEGCAFGYAITVVGTFVSVSWLLQWQVFGSRYHLPIFVLMAPLIGLVVAERIPPRAVGVVSLFLLAGALPCLVGLRPRPLLALGEGGERSILQVPRRELYFAAAEYLLDPYSEMVGAIQAEGCRNVGLALGGNGAEYPLWEMLGAPRSGVRLEWLVAGTPSARFAAPDFVPCAVVCQNCPGSWTQVHGLPEVYHSGRFHLFLAQ